MDVMDLFDNLRYTIARAEVSSMDPQQRGILETSDEALLRAGYEKKQLNKSLTGVYAGNPGALEWQIVPKYMSDPMWDMYSCTGGGGAIHANRVSFALGLMGPSIVIDSEGASFHCAFERGWMSFNENKYANIRCLAIGCNYMIVGNLWAYQSKSGFMWNQPWSPHGRCKAFEADCHGIIRSDNVGAVLMDPLLERVDGELVRDETKDCLGIVSSALCIHSGTGAALHAPNGPALQTLMAECTRLSKYSPMAIDVCETACDGLLLHDAVEVDAIKRILRPGERESDVPLALTASRSNLGHSLHGCGLSQVLQVIWAHKFGSIPPCVHLN